MTKQWKSTSPAGHLHTHSVIESMSQDEQEFADDYSRLLDILFCRTCGCELTYPLEVQPDCRYPDCENCHESETAHRAADGDR